MAGLREKIFQVAVHFACTIPLRTELRQVEREALKTALEELDRDHFQIFGGTIINPANPASPVLFAVQRQYAVDAGIATAPSLVFESSVISILHAVQIGRTRIARDLSGSEFNKRACDALFKIQEITKTKFTRASKVFELAVGPLNSNEKRALLSRLVVHPADDVFEMQLQMTRVQKPRVKLLNVNTQLRFQQARAEDAIVAGARFEVNNRVFETSLEPRDVQSVWEDADSLLDGLVADLLDAGGDHGKN